MALPNYSAFEMALEKLEFRGENPLTDPLTVTIVARAEKIHTAEADVTDRRRIVEFGN
jgi:hypothetical protein